MHAYIVSAGKCGLAFMCMSYVDYFKITCLSDESVIKDPSILIKLIEKNLEKCMQLTKDLSASESDSSTPRSSIINQQK